MTERASHIDLLTGAYKRQHFERLLAQAVSSAHRNNSGLSLLYLDVDNLQELNDIHGNTSVDTALAWLAQKISDVFDGRGPIGRIGGDEFAVVLPGVTVETAARLGEKLRQAVRQELHASAFGDYRLTVSVGVAARRPRELSGDLMEAGLAACTRAKQSGRDAVAKR